jgi:glucose/arabinose dehydrogenase
MQDLRLRDGKCRPVLMRACFEPLEYRRLMSTYADTPVAAWSAAADAQTLAAGAVPLAVQPTVTSVDPANGAANVNRGTKVTFSLQLVNGAPIDTNTLNTTNVKLNRTSDGQFVNCNVNTDAGGAVVVMQPTAMLAANTTYTVKITTGLKDTAGHSFVAFTATFTTGTDVPAQDSNIVFSKTNQANSSGYQYTSLAWGPDNKLYAGTLDGQILRFTIGSGGTLSTPEIFNTVNTNSGDTEFIIGLEFDPASTAQNPILWISHSAASDLTQNNAPDWTGKISKVSGSNLSTYQDVVVGLPRSVRDHVVDQLHFGPDGALYFVVPSMNAMGDVDPAWQRADHPLSGAMLRLDLSKLGSLPLDVKTSDGGGSYNPAAANAPLTIYATGIRNGYDFVWASNGHLYVAANGSAAGGNTPAGPGNSPPAMAGLTETMHDYVFDIKPGGYYGQPNVSRGEYILNGGNPTSGVDRNEITEYPVGTQPDSNYRYDAYDFGQNYAPTGMIEYHGSAFGGALNNRMLVTRYSGGDDVFILTPSHTGNTVNGISGVGMDGLNDPTDIIEDPNTGNLYVCQLGTANSGSPRNLITLFKPDSAPVVTKLQLINADSGVSLGALKAKGTFNLADLPTRNLSIKVLGTDLARVVFDLDGVTQDETSAPYALKGNNPDGSYKPWTPTTGMHTLTIQPYNGSGTAGASSTLVFWVIDQTKPFSAYVNFQPVNTPYVKGYKHDWGRLYGARGDGLTYGWNKSAQALMYDNNNPASPDQRFDTGVTFGGRKWDMAVPNGTYSVFILGGDLNDPNGTYNVAVEGVPALVGNTTAKSPWIGKTVQVTVTDNTLSITPLTGNVNQKLSFVQIVST